MSNVGSVQWRGWQLKPREQGGRWVSAVGSERQSEHIGRVPAELHRSFGDTPMPGNCQLRLARTHNKAIKMSFTSSSCRSNTLHWCFSTTIYKYDMKKTQPIAHRGYFCFDTLSTYVFCKTSILLLNHDFDSIIHMIMYFYTVELERLQKVIHSCNVGQFLYYSIIVDAEEPKILSLLFHGFFSLVKTWCLHYSPCNSAGKVWLEILVCYANVALSLEVW